jgi:hypothetical protein
VRFRLFAVGLALVMAPLGLACAPAQQPRAGAVAAPRVEAGKGLHPEGAPATPATLVAASTAPSPPTAVAEDAHGEPARLPLHAIRLALPAGRSLVEVAIPSERYVSIGVVGPSEALLSFDLVGPAALCNIRSRTALDEDGILPRIVSFWAPSGVETAFVLVDVAEPAALIRMSALPSPDPPALLPRRISNSASAASQDPAPPMLIGLPAPASRDDGYLLQSPARYQFLRVDVAHALIAAFRKTRVRFRRDPIAVADISQWDGLRPATDMGKPRHISHEGGRDVDIALPANDDGPSTVRPHCDGVLVEADAQGCAPGTVRGLDALRLAFLLGFLFDLEPEGRIEKIFLDDAYIREVRRATETLRARRWIKQAGLEGIHNDAIVRPSPWHVDHIHIRFAGRPAVSRWPADRE